MSTNNVIATSRLTLAYDDGKKEIIKMPVLEWGEESLSL